MSSRLLLFTLCVLLSSLASAQRNCGSMDYLEQQLEQDPERAFRMERLERFTEQYEFNEAKALSNGVLTIPVIVHVVYGNSTENISDAQINSQIAVLNADFRRLNSDRNNTPSDFVGVAADSEIEFCLTRIIRKSTTVGSFGTNDAVKRNSSGGSDAITPTEALNFWICDIGGGILGYAQFPGGAAATDGVVCDYRYVGTTGTATTPFNLGRTATHEVGHWLNLRHIWGDGGCSVDDFVADTPTAGGPNYTGGSCSYPGPNSCTGGRGKKRDPNDLPDMFQNYMDYSDDGCMNLFTLGQKDRMWAAVTAARPGLIGATCDGTPPPPTPEEICDNGLDDDGDGLTDCADPDCAAFASCGPPPGENCDAPTGLNANRTKGGRSANLSWNAANGAQNYEVEVYTGGTLYASGTVAGTSASLSGLNKNASYSWRVRSNCGGGVVSDFASSNFRELRLTGGSDREINIYPNPSNTGEVTLSWDLAATTGSAPLLTAGPATGASVQLEVRDLTGRLLQRRSVADTGRSSLDVSELTAGVYLVHVRAADGQAVSTKLVKY